MSGAKNKKVDGVYIVVGDYQDQGIYELAQKNIPVVSTDIIIPGIHSIISDNVMGINISLDFLFNQQNLKTVGMIAGPQTSKAFAERFEAYKSYLMTHNKICNKDFIVEAESFGYTSGYNATLKLLKQTKILPEALLIGSDDIALGVLKPYKSVP